MSKLDTPEKVVEALERLYEDAVKALTESLETYLHDGTPPDIARRTARAFCYPALIVRYDPDGPPPPISRAFGKMSEPGTYMTTVTRPDYFRPYLIEQLTPLMRDCGWHLMGTARMGEDPERSVVNQYGQSHDVENLFIYDGSVFVTSSGFNPTGTISAIALRSVKHLIANRRNQKVAA